ncbi:MAG: DUF5069 domain-containing protein [Candidatus Eremiobacteraeota bacterium]|nr:DUF5069 domain-containing protein [Candidatus Eremiobacteraeota bacterium]MBV8353901.1 DUF5069 domain-containing protein [Candidatus Eremiobacteraeota bacterium]
MAIAPPDLTQSPPRRGREELGGFVWLPRVLDTARAALAGTNGKYAGYDEISKAWLQNMGIMQQHFNAVVESGADDDFVVMFMNRRVDHPRRERANRFILEDHKTDLDRLDREEGYT